MIYSVWDPVNKVYQYYQTVDGSKDNLPPVPAHLKKIRSTPIGIGNDIAWALPADAKQVGSGPVAHGMIAAIRSGGNATLGDFNLTSWLPWIGIGIVAYLVLR